MNHKQHAWPAVQSRHTHEKYLKITTTRKTWSISPNHVICAYWDSNAAVIPPIPLPRHSTVVPPGHFNLSSWTAICNWS